MTTLAEEREKRHLKALERLRGDMALFGRECLKIEDKDGQTVPMILNRQQSYIHERAEAHRAKFGKVRLIVGKGRQTGISTYFAARHYHRATLNRGVRCHILTHEQEATDTLFKMIARFHKHNPIRPSTADDNAKSLEFDILDGGYSVGTARTTGGGRSKRLSILHWSEVAHSPNAAGHFAGIVQSVPDLPGTEIVLESTGDGPAGEYFERWQQAEAGLGDYEAVFVPWFWTLEYARFVPEGFSLDEDEARYQSLHGLTLGQMVWRRAKIAELRDPVLFKQEYPASAVEMFEASGKASYINPELVIHARKATKEGIGPLVVGVDPSRFGDDRFSIAWRRGRQVSKIESRTKIGTTEALAWLKDIIDQDRPVKMFIDAGGGGDRLFDILTSWGDPYDKAVVLVNFGGKPQTEMIVERDGTRRAGPANRRVEMWMRSKMWLEQEGGADLPDMDSLASDAAAPRFHYRTTDQALQLESKEQIRARGVRSPDEWDAVCFVAGTIIETPYGQRRIETLAVGDLVHTPFGPTQVGKLWCTQTDIITTVSFSNGSVLRGKGSHRLFTWRLGACRMDAIPLTVEVEPYSQWRMVLWRIASGLCIEARRIGFKPAVDITARANRLTASAFFIAAFGWTVTALSRRVSTSITRMVIGETTTSTTSKLWMAVIMCANTWWSALVCQGRMKAAFAVSNWPPSKLRSGTDRLMEPTGIESMQKGFGRPGSQLEPFALAASGHIGPISLIGLASVQEPAARQKVFVDILLMLERVIGAGRRLWRTAIGLRPVVPVSVQTESVPLTPVFNLTLKRHNAYYANGILAYNCLTFAEPVKDPPPRPASSRPMIQAGGSTEAGTAWLGT